MGVFFYITAAIAVFSTAMVVTRFNIMHALLYLIVSLLSVAVIFYLYGAPYMASLEIIVYAGAIMVLIIFFVMMLNLGPESTRLEKQWLKPGMWMAPALFCVILLGELVYLIAQNHTPVTGIKEVPPKAVGRSLFGPYILAVELSAMLLMAGIVGAYHLGRQQPKTLHRFLQSKPS